MTYQNFVWLSCLAVLMMSSANCQKNHDGQDAIIAVVGNEQLTVNDLMEDIPVQIRANLTVQEIREFVLKWINNQVLYQEALTRKLDERDDLQRQFEKLRKQLLVNKLVEQTLEDDILVTEEEIRNYYDNHKEAYVLQDDIIHAHHLLTATRAEAVSARQRLLNGASVQELVMSAGTDTSDASPYRNDWDWGYFSKSDITAEVPEISTAVFKLQKGDVSAPIQSDYGYHVLTIIDKQKKGDHKDLELVRDEVRLTLETRKKQDRYQRFLLQIKSKFKIETNFQILESVVLDSLATGA